MSIYQSSKWKKFSKDFIKNHGYYCDICNKTDDEDVVFQVHHKSYNKKIKPWDHDKSLLDVLCKGCHAKAHGQIPNYKWEWEGDNDRGDLGGVCDFCGREIRYEHFVSHPYWGEFTLGSVHADTILENHLATKIAAYWYINESNKKLQDFMNSNDWKTKGGNSYLKLRRINEVDHNIRINLIESEKNLFSISFDFLSKHRHDSLLQLNGTFDEITAKKIAYLARAFIYGAPKGWVEKNNGSLYKTLKINQQNYMIYKARDGENWRGKIQPKATNDRIYFSESRSLEGAKCKLFEWYFENIAKRQIESTVEEPPCVKEV